MAIFLDIGFTDFNNRVWNDVGGFMTTKAELRRLENLRKQKEVEAIRWKDSMAEAGFWSQDKVNSLVADFQKTIETLTAELARMHNERDVFMSWLLPFVSGDGHLIMAADIKNKAKEVFK